MYLDITGTCMTNGLERSMTTVSSCQPMAVEKGRGSINLSTLALAGCGCRISFIEPNSVDSQPSCVFSEPTDAVYQLPTHTAAKRLRV